jgi:hypothetical protein
MMKVFFVVQAGKFALPIISQLQGQRVSVFASRPKAAPEGPQLAPQVCLRRTLFKSGLLFVYA